MHLQSAMRLEPTSITWNIVTQHFPNIRPLDPAKNNLRTLQFSEIFLPLVSYRQIINRSSTCRNSMSINIHFILIGVFHSLAVAKTEKHPGNHQTL